MMKQFKPVLEVEEILARKSSKKEILFALWDWEKSSKAQPGSQIASKKASDWEEANFGNFKLTNVWKYHFCGYWKNQYPLVYEKYSQVENTYRGKDIVSYDGLHRTEILSRIKKFSQSYYNIPYQTNEERFLKKYGPLGSLGLQTDFEELELYIKSQIVNFNHWSKNTKLPMRYYLGKYQDGSLSAFEKRKSNLDYIVIQSKHIAIENTEHWEGMEGECHHGVGRLKSVDRGVWVNGKLYPVKRFDSGFLLDVLIPILKPKKVEVPEELQSIQLEDHFDVEMLIDYKSSDDKDKWRLYQRKIFGLVWDYCIVNSDGVTFHSESKENLLEGLKNKIEKMINRKQIKEKFTTNNDEILDLTEFSKNNYYKKEYRLFIKTFDLGKKIVNKKLLKSDLLQAFETVTKNKSPNNDITFTVRVWIEKVPFFRDLYNQWLKKHSREEKKRNLKKLRISLNSVWDIEKAREEFGFCLEGMKVFCKLNKIDPNGKLKGSDILSIAQKNKELNFRFKRELGSMFPGRFE